MGVMKKRRNQKPLRQTTLDEFTAAPRDAARRLPTSGAFW
jgi:hypothetical protein